MAAAEEDWLESEPGDEPPVYASELDTPHLFNLYPPADFFVHFCAADFERSNYPPVPDTDVRALEANNTNAAWTAHRTLSTA